jgi:hypothetical protein
VVDLGRVTAASAAAAAAGAVGHEMLNFTVEITVNILQANKITVTATCGGPFKCTRADRQLAALPFD